MSYRLLHPSLTLFNGKSFFNCEFSLAFGHKRRFLRPKTDLKLIWAQSQPIYGQLTDENILANIVI